MRKFGRRTTVLLLVAVLAVIALGVVVDDTHAWTTDNETWQAMRDNISPTNHEAYMDEDGTIHLTWTPASDAALAEYEPFGIDRTIKGFEQKIFIEAEEGSGYGSFGVPIRNVEIGVSSASYEREGEVYGPLPGYEEYLLPGHTYRFYVMTVSKEKRVRDDGRVNVRQIWHHLQDPDTYEPLEYASVTIPGSRPAPENLGGVELCCLGDSYDVNVFLSWDPASDLSYTKQVILRRELRPGTELEVISDDVDTYASRFIDTTTEYNKRYVYRVAAVKADGSLVKSKPARVETGEYLPGPSDLYSNTDEEVARLRWREGTDDYAKHLILRREAVPGTKLEVIAEVDKSVRGYSDVNVESGKTYIYRVQGEFADGSKTDRSNAIRKTISE